MGHMEMLGLREAGQLFLAESHLVGKAGVELERLMTLRVLAVMVARVSVLMFVVWMWLHQGCRLLGVGGLWCSYHSPPLAPPGHSLL